MLKQVALTTVIVILWSPLVCADDAAELEHFERRVRPLLVQHCIKCHGGKKSEGGLRLDTSNGITNGGDSGAVLVPGKPDRSRLIRALNYDDLDL